MGKLRRFAVIGSVAAASCAAAKAKRVNPEVEVILVERYQYIPCSGG